ncbi:MAG: hypothetical protein KAR40_06045 [Candidatus Sabulitectum sp.]|nr:hypothetical protein [Candidatus Sabulitectum sp.]
MSLRSQFKTDKSLETKGIVIDYGDTKITAARAGGANKRYMKRLDFKTKPFRRAMIAGSMDTKLQTSILMAVIAETVVLDWKTKVKNKWVKGIDPEDAGKPAGKLLPVSVENITAVFENLPDLFMDLQAQVQNGALYRDEINEEDLGN